MIVRASLATLFLAGIAAGLAAQPVPEGIHSPGGDRPTLCGTTAATVPALQAELARRLPGLPGNERYVALHDEPNMRVWTFTTAAHPAHPAVACRTVMERDGDVSVSTEISCYSSRENCDALYREFEELNARMRRELPEQQGGDAGEAGQL